MALVATSMTFAIRANLIGPLGNEFALSPKAMGVVFGTAFWGFTLSMLIGGTLCDLLGMKRLLSFAFIGHLLGIALTILSQGFWTLFVSTLLIGVANGFVEAACNPLIASLYPEKKTEQLNKFHVWFPGGIVIGGLVAFAFTRFNLSWHWQVGSIFIPTVLYGISFLKLTFPVTERVEAGIDYMTMLRECKRPLFLFMVLCMLLTAATELGTNQWISELLSQVGIPSILLLVFINGLMAIGRSFAGNVEHKLSPSGMLLCSALFSALGLYLLSQSVSYWSFGAAAIFAIGICYFWPTMLGFVAEYLPKTGALGLSIMGGAGMLSVSLILPFIGDFYQAQTQSFLPEGYTMTQLVSAPKGSPESGILAHIQLLGGSSTLKWVALLPVFLSIAFTWLYLTKRNYNTNKTQSHE